MANHEHAHGSPSQARTGAHCCCPEPDDGITRRGFLDGATLGSMALSWLTWSELSAAADPLPTPPKRRPLVVKPVLTYWLPQRQKQTSWRSWGGIQTQADVDQELARIRAELDKLRGQADFPVEFLPTTAIDKTQQWKTLADAAGADVLLIYAAGGGQELLNAANELGKPIVFFLREKSGPLSFYYEAISPWYFRHNTDQLATKAADYNDVVVDVLDELTWRLRALCGLKNTRGTRIVAIGRAGGWAKPKAPELAKERFRMEIQVVPYPELGKLIKAARQDEPAVALARSRAEAYLKLPGTTLQTDRKFVDNAFLLEQIFRQLMRKADCRAITIGACMSTIMPLAETSACLTLSTLNDDGYLAFCESDFVVIPSGILLANISGRPVFLNDPTYPHHHVVTIAHCTGPRKMDGKNLEPARIMTHFESDYGAAPKVEMRKGQMTTNILPSFAADRWVGVLGEIVDAPLLDICRDQIDIRFRCDAHQLALRMPGFHWMTCYGDYTKELGYALKHVGIQWECLG
jgi:hypothetical protein